MSQNKRRVSVRRASSRRSEGSVNRSGGHARVRKKRIEDEQKILHAQIGALEGFIAGSPFRESRQRVQSKQVIPPPEMRKRHVSGKRRVCYAQQRQRHAQRDVHVIIFFLLFVAACWLAWWLLGTA